MVFGRGIGECHALYAQAAEKLTGFLGGQERANDSRNDWKKSRDDAGL